MYTLLLICITSIWCTFGYAAEPAQKQQSEYTCALIKPDAVKAKYTGEIIKLIELNGFTIVRMKKIRLTKKQAQKFYQVHKGRPFYNYLVNYMTSGPIVAMALEKINAIVDWRQLMGATNPEKASVGTLRKMFGTSTQANATHGSDSAQSAEQELFLLFPDLM